MRRTLSSRRCGARRKQRGAVSWQDENPRSRDTSLYVVIVRPMRGGAGGGAKVAYRLASAPSARERAALVLGAFKEERPEDVR
jgi:hypothetical protein